MTHETKAMSLTLYFHPLSSYCQKVLIALYENETPFAPELVDLGNEQSRAAFQALWAPAKMPVLRDAAAGRVVPESSIIIEYLAQHYPGRTPLLPADAERALETRRNDRFFDLHVQDPMQKIVGDRLRPAGKADPHGVAHAKAQLATSYGVLERQMATRTWADGDTFSMADCAAAPALFYADLVAPFRQTHNHLAAYFDRLMRRPSFARAVEEAKPYFKYFPQEAHA
jgi:glutathione S-transferase